MPDDTRMPRHAPRDWTDAFAALPLESPQGDAWARIVAGIQPAAEATHPPRRHRRPLWLAVAAVAALAVALPLSWRPASTPAPQPATTSDPVALRATEASPTAVRPASPSPTASATGRSGDLPRPVADMRTAKRASTKVRPAATIDRSDETALAALQAQSAQLEGLLAMARDERVASGVAAAMGDQLDAEVARIDAALIQPELDPHRRAALWALRVDALQQLAGIEATQRLYAARGLNYDVALVGID